MIPHNKGIIRTGSRRLPSQAAIVRVSRASPASDSSPSRRSAALLAGRHHRLSMELEFSDFEGALPLKPLKSKLEQLLSYSDSESEASSPSATSSYGRGMKSIFEDILEAGDNAAPATSSGMSSSLTPVAPAAWLFNEDSASEKEEERLAEVAVQVETLPELADIMRNRAFTTCCKDFVEQLDLTLVHGLVCALDLAPADVTEERLKAVLLNKAVAALKAQVAAQPSFVVSSNEAFEPESSAWQHVSLSEIEHFCMLELMQSANFKGTERELMLRTQPRPLDPSQPAGSSTICSALEAFDLTTSEALRNLALARDCAKLHMRRLWQQAFDNDAVQHWQTWPPRCITACEDDLDADSLESLGEGVVTPAANSSSTRSMASAASASAVGESCAAAPAAAAPSSSKPRARTAKPKASTATRKADSSSTTTTPRAKAPSSLGIISSRWSVLVLGIIIGALLQAALTSTPASAAVAHGWAAVAPVMAAGTTLVSNLPAQASLFYTRLPASLNSTDVTIPPEYAAASAALLRLARYIKGLTAASPAVPALAASGSSSTAASVMRRASPALLPLLPHSPTSNTALFAACANRPDGLASLLERVAAADPRVCASATGSAALRLMLQQAAAAEAAAGPACTHHQDAAFARMLSQVAAAEAAAEPKAAGACSTAACHLGRTLRAVETVMTPVVVATGLACIVPLQAHLAAYSRMLLATMVDASG